MLVNASSPARGDVKATNASALRLGAKLYIVALALAALGLTLHTLTGAGMPDSRRVALALVFTGLVTLANLFPLHVSLRTMLTLDTAATFAVVLLFPPGIGMLIVGLGSIIGDTIRRKLPEEVLFNGSQLALQAGIGSLILAGADWYTGEFLLNRPEQMLTIVFAAGAMFLINAVFVAVMIGLQSGLTSLSVWYQLISGFDRVEHLSHLSQLGFGLLVAVVADAHSWALPLLLGPAVATYRLLDHHVQLREQTTNTVRQLAIMEERGRIAHEMHDSVAQVLGYVNTKAQAAQELMRAGELEQAVAQISQLARAARVAYADVREDILGLRTSLTPERRFLDTLTNYLTHWQEQSDIPVELEIDGDRYTIRLPMDAELQLTRIIQEALANVRKHAGAKRAHVRLQRREDWVEAIVEDDGAGFDPLAPARGLFPRFGLTTMRERAGAVRGSLVIDSAPGRGTRVIARVPADLTPIAR